MKTLGVERTGPFVPPVSLPSGMGVLVTERFRDSLLVSGLTGLRFLRARKFKIVKFDWTKWNRSSKLPARVPFGGEPEGYINQGKHSVTASREMQGLFELRPTRRLRFVTCGTEHKWGSEWPILRVSFADWRGEDFFLGERGHSVYVTARAKKWMETRTGDEIAFAQEQWAPRDASQ